MLDTTTPSPSPSATRSSPEASRAARSRPCCLCSLDDRLAAFIADNPGAKRSDLVDGVGCSESVLRRALPRLRAKGRIRQDGMRSTARYYLVSARA